MNSVIYPLTEKQTKHTTKKLFNRVNKFELQRKIGQFFVCHVTNHEKEQNKMLIIIIGLHIYSIS